MREQEDAKIIMGICDDEEASRKQIHRKLEKILDGEDIEIQEFESGKELLKACADGAVLSILYLDIYLEEENGIQIAKELEQLCPGIKIVFITESRDFAIEAFALKALHYLVKPVTEDGIRETLNRFRETKEETGRIYLNIDREKVALPLVDVAYLKSENHKTQIVQKDGGSISTYTALKDLETFLTKDFLKVKRGIIVNMDFIEVISTTFCILKNGMDLEISRMYRTEIKKQYEAYVMRVLKKRRMNRGNE